jgi:hypothetical protein
LHPEDFFVLRTPLLPFEVAESLSDALEARAALDDRDRLEAALDRDRARIRARLRALVSEPAIREAIFVASPDLDRAIDRWIEEPGAARGTEVEGALFRYVLRMAARPTPFGLFAGCGVGAIGDTTALTVSARDGCRRHTRLDMDYLVQLADVLAREPALAPSVIYTPNSSLSRVAGRWRYVETRLRQGYGGQARAHQGYGGQARAHQGDGGQARAHQGDGGQARAHQGDGGQARTRQGDDGQARTRQGDGGQAGSGTGEAERSHHLVALEDSDHLDATIERARPGATRAALAEALAGGGVNRAEADAFVGELIDSQILVPDVECPITGPEPLARLEALARRHPDAGAIAERLGEVAARLRAIDEGGLGAPRSRYHDIAAELEPLGAPVEISRLFQVDLIRPASFASLGRDLADEVVRGVAVLRRLAPRIEPGELDRFRTAFADRYEQREVPLAEALDEETGVGSALGDSASRDVSALLGGLDFPAPSIESTVWSRREATLLHRVGETLVAGGHELTLTPGDIEAMASDDGAPLPDAWSALATIVRPCGETANGAGVRVMLHHSSGPSGAPLLGRFCHGDPALLAAVRDHLRAEEALDREAVFAEVVHLPHGRTGNILLRPELRQYEVPYLGRSGVPADRQIPIDDLTVALSDGRFVLRSRRLGRRVVPRLTTAHNFIAGSLTLYRFFCLLQSDGRLPWCGWSWGALASLPFLPRVTFGRLVFSRATWRVTRDEARPLITASGAARFAAVQAWRVSRRLRRWILLVEHDNLLPLDLDNVSAVDELVRQLKDRESAVLMEMYPGPGELCASGDDGRYTHEVLIPFHGEALPQTARHVSSGHHRAGLKQGLPPVSSCPAPPPHHAQNAWRGPRPPGERS